jgi:hypothetical protein
MSEKTPTERYQFMMLFAKNRERAAYTYSLVLKEPQGTVNVGEVERIMFSRWSESGVRFIKRLARRRGDE